MKQFIDIAIPVITILLLWAVGMALTRADFARVRRSPPPRAAGPARLGRRPVARALRGVRASIFMNQ